MTPAYTEEYLDDAMGNLGEAFDYAQECFGLSPDEFLAHFCATGLARAFGHGEARIIAGHSGTELVLEVLGKAGLLGPSYPPARKCYDFSSIYWCGWLLAFVQWRSGRSFAEIHTLLPMTEILSRYPSLHEAGEARAADAIEALLRQREPHSKLQRLRRQAGLTQKALGEKTGLSVRTLQQYEMRTKDINRAAGESILGLSRALGCQMEDLLENAAPSTGSKPPRGRPRRVRPEEQ